MTLLQRRLNSVPCTLQLLTEHGPPVDSFVQVVPPDGMRRRFAAWLLSGSPPVRTSRCQFVVQFIATGFHVVSMVKPGKD